MNPLQRPQMPAVPETTAGNVATRLEEGAPPYLLDVREPYEWDEVHIEEATLIPLSQLNARVGELPRDREIVCICRSGQRSAFATQALERAGYDATNMAGGMLNWVRQGYPVVRG